MSKSYLIKPPLSIFKEYDIQSQISEDLNENTYYTLGVAIGSELQEMYGLHTLLLCRDSRASSEAFSEALIKGLLLSGTHIIDIGCLPTPVLYFAMQSLQCLSGLIITASHNPADHNGLKIILGGHNYYGQRLRTLHQRIDSEQFVADNQGRAMLIRYPSEQIISKYIQTIKNNMEHIKKLRVVVDCGNAVAGYVAPQLLSELGCEVIPLYCDVQSTFINHNPDPSIPGNLTDLSQVVLEHHADLGIALDGDGDRIGIVDNKGDIIPADYLLLAFADALLKKQSDSVVVCDVKCTQHLHEYIAARNGRAIMTKTGTANIMASMIEHQAAIGGEFCGHFYFRDRWIHYDDGLYAAARTLEMLSGQSHDMHSLFKRFPASVSTNELRIAIDDRLKEEFMKQLLVQAPLHIQGELTHLDGLKVNLANAWGLIRPSNTGPYLTLRFEAKSMQALHDIKLLFARLINAVNPLLELPFLINESD